MKIFKLMTALVLALAFAVACGWGYVVGWAPERSTYAEQGVDVSADSGAIDWEAARESELDFAYVRATHGADVRDPSFDQHWAALTHAGLRHGALHSYSLCHRADEQAGNFTATVPRDVDALPVAIDLDFREDCPARPVRDVVLDEVRTLAATLETHSGKPVILKISAAFEAQYQISGAIDRPLWASRAFLKPDYLARPWTLWQASSVRRIKGAERPVNWNVIAP